MSKPLLAGREPGFVDALLVFHDHFVVEVHLADVLELFHGLLLQVAGVLQSFDEFDLLLFQQLDLVLGIERGRLPVSGA